MLCVVMFSASMHGYIVVKLAYRYTACPQQMNLQLLDSILRFMMSRSFMVAAYYAAKSRACGRNSLEISSSGAVRTGSGTGMSGLVLAVTR